MGGSNCQELKGPETANYFDSDLEGHIPTVRRATFSEGSLFDRHCSKCFTRFYSFNPHNNLMRQVLLLSFYRGGN